MPSTPPPLPPGSSRSACLAMLLVQPSDCPPQCHNIVNICVVLQTGGAQATSLPVSPVTSASSLEHPARVTVWKVCETSRTA